MEVEKIMQDLERKHPGELEFLQAVREVLESIKDVYNQHPEFERAKIIERIVEPERITDFSAFIEFWSANNLIRNGFADKFFFFRYAECV